MYNMSNAISQGNMQSQSVANLNDSIRQTNKANASRAKTSVTTAVDKDKEIGIMTGIKEGASEVSALGNVASSVANYKEAVANQGKPGFTEVKPTDDDLKPKAPAEGEAIDEAVERPSAAIQTSEGTLDEGSDILSKGKGIVAGGEAVEGAAGTGLKIAGAVGKGVGVLGGLATAGLDVAAEYKSLKSGQGLAGDNLAEKIANIGAIGGSALDMLGFVPGLQILGVVGSGIQAASGVLDEVGNAVETKQKEQADQNTPPPATIQQTAQSSLAGSFANVRTS